MLHDLRFALRLLIKSPGFTAAAIVALGFGIGLSTSVFNAFAGILLRPLPHLKDEHRLVFLNSQQIDKPDDYYELSLPDFLDIRKQSKTLEGATTTMDRTMIFAGADPQRVLGSSISVEGLAMLGVTPHRGRLFTEAEGKADAPRVAIIGHALWKQRFAGKDEVVGQTVEVNGAMHTIIGVMPPGFTFPDTSEMWVPFIYENEDKERGSHDFPGWARLRPGVTLDEAKAEIATLAAQLALTYKDTNEGKTLAVRLVREEATEDVSELMRLMLGASIIVLLIACANVANLMLARAAGRSHEIAIRISVGATRGRIMRQVLTESLLLGALGGAFGLLVATWADSILFAGVPPAQIAFWMTFGFDWRVFSFAFGAAIISALIFGLLPALQISRSASVDLREGSRSVTSSRNARIFRQSLVVAQIALSSVLLIGAGLFVRSFLKLQSTPPGFDPKNVITFRVGLPPTQYKDKAQIRAFFDKLTPTLEAMPGVVAAGATHVLPSNGNDRTAFLLEGEPMPKNLVDAPHAVFHAVTHGYLKAMRIPLLRGREFNETDTRDKPIVALVDQRFVDRWMNGANPIGKRVSLGLYSDPDRKWAEIVGVVGNVPQKLDEPYEIGGLYYSIDQSENNFVNYALRVTGDPASYGKAIQKAVLSVQPNIPIYHLHTMEYIQDTAYWARRFFSQAFGAFGLGALFLAALGVYGVMAYSVTQRTAEIGVRMALGASEKDVMRLVSRQGLMLVALGIGIGLISALGLTQLMASLLYEISPSDPPTYFALTGVLAITGLIACWLPARRAARINPLVAIRTE
ncbi:ABC transporter permease [Oleiharenicola lentus]|uniref:ABC transporter permease n=1 Tax=Oleiharenicola lentus TaxID=2508720 RepID=UPI003F66FB41